MDFLPTEVDTTQAGSTAELPVWEAIKNAFEVDDLGIAYYKFPVVDKSGQEYDRELDFVLLHQELGLIVIECKGYQIDHIESIQGQVWNLQGIRQSKAKPYPQARDQAFKVNSYFTRQSELTDEMGRCRIPVNVLIALPNISRSEWEARGFNELPSTPRVITKDELSPQALRDKLFAVPKMDTLSTAELRAARSVLGGGSVIGNEGTAAPPDPGTKGEFYDTVEQHLPKLDKKQEEIGIQIPPGPQRIRGIAGSGKTVLMAMKAARMHAKHPEWDIAVTFMTKSLYPQMQNLISRFYWHFAEEEPNWNKLQLLHGWGGHTVLDGMYFVLARESESHDFLNVDGAQAQFGRFNKLPDLLDSCCESLLDSRDVPVMFDAILIDEAQDFLPGFFKMCRAALREPKRLVWAYDEAQSLGSLTAPRSENLFGIDENGAPLVDLSGSYEGGIQRSQVMRKAYRSPRQVLMAAHYFGMGLKRTSGAVQAITTQLGWENLGYEVVDGDFRRTGEDIRIRRPAQNSPHPLSKYDAACPFVRFSAAETKQEEMELIAENISRDITDHDLAPEQIMVILLDPRSKRKADELTNYIDAATADSIVLNRVWEGESSVFAVDGEVTITRINRAKGNEAAMVYLAGLEHVDDVESGQPLVQRRNQAFVAMTRTRGWCHVTGTGSCDAFDEMQIVLNDVTADEPELIFPAPDPQSLENEMEVEPEPQSTTLDEFAVEEA